MPTYKSAEFLNSIKSKKLSPVYLLCGIEQFLLEEALIQIEKILNTSSLNKDIYFAGQSDIEEVINSCQTPPFLGEKRLVVLKSAEKLKKDELLKLAGVLNNPPDFSLLVIYFNERYKKDLIKNPVFAACEKYGIIVDFKAVYDSEMPGWITNKVNAAGKKITSEAAQYLAQETGTSLLDAINEIEKLLLYTRDAKEISLKDVEELSGHTRQINLNQLHEALESKNLPKTLKIMEDLLNEGEIPLRVLTTIQKTVKRLLVAKSLKEEDRRSDEEIKRSLFLNPYFDRYFFSNLSKFNLTELKMALDLFVNADFQLKSSSRPENMILEELILKVLPDNQTISQTTSSLP